MLLAGCGLVMGEDLDGLTVTVTNRTDSTLTVLLDEGDDGQSPQARHGTSAVSAPRTGASSSG